MLLVVADVQDDGYALLSSILGHHLPTLCTREAAWEGDRISVLDREKSEKHCAELQSCRVYVTSTRRI
jgi:hypothetical protein